MLSERKFNIQKFKMTEEMRTSILDVVRSVIEANIDDVQSTETLKRVIEQKYGGKWQVVIGKDMSVYFDQNIIKDYIILQTQIKTMIIFRKKHLEQSLHSQPKVESPMRMSKNERSTIQNQ